MTADNYLHEKHTQETMRMPPVLLGVASAAIGFAFHETADRELTNSLWFVLAAVLAWGASFASGVLFSREVAAAIQANIAINIAKGRERADWTSISESKFKAANRWAQRFYSLQQWFLLLGACFYLAGHILHLMEIDPKRDIPSPVIYQESAMTKPDPSTRTETPQSPPRYPGVNPPRTNPVPSKPDKPKEQQKP